ncbi:cohesin domain-containing protein [Pseudomonadota bacterium]
MSNNKKAFLLGFVFMALSVFGVAEAAPELSAGTVSGAPGEQVTVPVNYTSDGTVAALQFDIHGRTVQ